MADRVSKEVLLAVKRFFHGGDGLVKVVHEPNAYMEWNVIETSLQSYLRRHALPTVNVHISPEFLKPLGFVKRPRQTMCGTCRNRAVKNLNSEQHCSCEKPNQRKRYERLLIENIKMFKRNSEGESWVPIAHKGKEVKRRRVEMSTPPAPVPVADLTAKESQISDPATRDEKEACTFDEEVWQAVNHKFSCVVEARKDCSTEALIQKVPSLCRGKHTLVLHHKIQKTLREYLLSNSRTPYCHVHSFEDAAQAAYKLPHHLSDNTALQLATKIMAQEPVCEEWRNFFELIVVDRAHMMDETTYVLTKQLVQANPQAQLLFFGSTQQIFVPGSVDANFLHLAPEIYDKGTGREWTRLSQIKISVRDLVDDCLLDDLLPFFNERVLPSKVPIPSPEPFGRLIGSYVPMAYAHRGHYFALFQTMSLKNPIWTSEGAGPLALKFLVLRQNPDPWSTEQLSFMFLCYDLEQGSIFLADFLLHASTDWMGFALPVAFAEFQKLGLRCQEEHVHRKNVYGQIDGRTSEGKIVELKYTTQIRLEHKVQILLYLCLSPRDDQFCLLYNFKTGENIELSCQRGFLDKALQTRKLTLTQSRFIQAHVNEPGKA